MSRQSQWAQRKREEVTFILGGKCAHCGLHTNLTFDCIKPVNQGHHKMSSAQRMTFYVRQMRLGNLQILCHDCNVRKSNKPNGKYIPSVLTPTSERILTYDEAEMLDQKMQIRCPATD